MYRSLPSMVTGDKQVSQWQVREETVGKIIRERERERRRELYGKLDHRVNFNLDGQLITFIGNLVGDGS